jgi:hypothetical protein
VKTSIENESKIKTSQTNKAGRILATDLCCRNIKGSSEALNPYKEMESTRTEKNEDKNIRCFFSYLQSL